MNKVLELGPRPHLRVERVRRDLRIEAHEMEEVQLRSGTDVTEVERLDNVTVIRAQGSLRLRVPSDSILEVGHVGGDLSLAGLASDCHVGQVGGDAQLDKCAGLLIDRIGGDILASQVRGDVSLKAVGGDVVLQDIEGRVRLTGAGGDVVLSKVGGEIQVAVGGDATVNLHQELAGDAEISGGGDVFCRLPAEASIAAKLMAGGDLRVMGSDVPNVEWGRASFERAGGEYALSISAGGDIWLALGESEQAPMEMADLGTTIAAKVGEKIAEMETALSAMGAELNGLSSGMISDRVQKIVDRAVRRQEQVEARASLREAVEQGFARGQGVSDKERIKVLKLLEEKKITLEQAEELLDALEG